MTYRFVTWREDGIWSTMSPAVPGVFGLGKTRAAAEADFKSSLYDLLAYLREIKVSRPRSSTAVFTGNVRV